MRITDTHIYFFSGNSKFSNFAITPFTYVIVKTSFLDDNTITIKFQCSEQAYMYEKCMFFNQPEMAMQCIEETNPTKVKKIGRSIPNFEQDKWNKFSFDVMYKICLQKFQGNEEAKKELIDSGDKVLVEASPYDKIWGVGLSELDDRILQEEYWEGENRLGKVLMKVRNKIK